MSQVRSETHDIKGRPWAKLSELHAGQTIHIDGGFTCAAKGAYLLQNDDDGLYFRCDDGRHYLSGQADDGEHCVGVYKTELSK